MTVIDTNIFLEFLLGQEKADGCLAAIASIIDSEEDACVSSFSLHSIEVIMTRKNLIKELGSFLAALDDSLFIKVYYTTVREEQAVLDVMGGTGLDFDDSIQYFLAKKLNAPLLTLDRHFDSAEGIRAVRP